jgi:hypothetical protein
MVLWLSVRVSFHSSEASDPAEQAAAGLLASEALAMIAAQAQGPGGARGDAVWALLYGPALAGLLKAVATGILALRGAPLGELEAGAAAGVSAVRRCLLTRADAAELVAVAPGSAPAREFARTVAAALRRANAARSSPMERLAEAARAWNVSSAASLSCAPS